jgi:formamidopyrimidine-DNA glycosylase
MLEIPESQLISKQLNQTVQGKTIKRVDANSSPHGFAFFYGDPNRYPSLLTGKTIVGAKALGGMVEIAAEEMRVVLSDGANLRYVEPGAPLPLKHQLHIEFEDQSSLVCTIQMYAGLWAFEDGENMNPYYVAAKEKPSPLTREFDAAYFGRLLDNVKPALSVKPFLATEQRIPGLGNGVLQDILFNARINPRTTLDALSDAEKDTLLQSIKQTLLDMTAKGGRDTEKDLFGCSGGYPTLLSNKTLKWPCPACGGTIVKQAYLGGSVYYCPTCQPVRKGMLRSAA